MQYKSTGILLVHLGFENLRIVLVGTYLQGSTLHHNTSSYWNGQIFTSVISRRNIYEVDYFSKQKQKILSGAGAGGRTSSIQNVAEDIAWWCTDSICVIHNVAEAEDIFSAPVPLRNTQNVAEDIFGATVGPRDIHDVAEDIDRCGLGGGRTPS
ncbi:hypothetical protein P167DRAFT_545828 [Morchella conica CCBAS932]|uniref:Uncharacterized protein n=1 Tax=Morchella conica CCBAS932 TaxID=1392247 RepID=A0A3N4KND0_9PEZI|nr:hypothetical protein P167DRAFT_545828 [Morchella conica CCBAS932]